MDERKNRQEKYITSTMERILLSLNKTKHYSNITVKKERSKPEAQSCVKYFYGNVI